MPPRVRWFNTYGLTETAVTSLLFEFRRGEADLSTLERVPVGKPIAGTYLRIDAEEHGRGELLLGGAGVGLGYFGTLTPGAFFNESGERDDVRWFRTGDMARVTADGNVEIAGRLDRLVKLRGMRVALPELEATLASHPAVKECVAVASGALEEGAVTVDLHVVLLEGQVVAAAELFDFYSKAMPAAPAPASFRFHDAIPRTAGRKTDYAALQQLAADTVSAMVRSPAGDNLHNRIGAIFRATCPIRSSTLRSTSLHSAAIPC